MAGFSDLFGRLSPDKNVRGRQFEAICRWFLEQDPVYSRELRRVWLWKDWPGRWGPDAGIDLVAEPHNGGLWAIQAKAYDPAHTITKADADTFLSESARPEFAFRLLIATTNRVGKTARRTIEHQEKPASLLLRGDLERAEVKWPKTPDDMRAPPQPRKRPRPHQREAIDAIIAGFDDHDRGQMIMACGTGKTLAALFIAEELQARRTLVLVPSLSLLSQTLREWSANASEPFEFLPVCSDETVADPDSLTSNVSELGFPVTTDPAEIAAFLRRRGRRVLFSTYQSSPQIEEAYQLGRIPRFDLAIADEAHRCAGRVSKDFGTILDPNAIPARRLLFMTATPRYFTGRLRREAGEAQFEVASMDDEEAFGPVFHRLTFGEAIERDLLSDYRVAVVAVDDATYREWAEQGRFVTRDGEVIEDARTLAGQIGVAKAIAEYDLRRVITFHSRVKKARDFSLEIRDVIDWMPDEERPGGEFWSDFVSGEMPAGDRDIRLGHLRLVGEGERALLSNARCLGEGVDVPALDGVAFVDPRRSEVDIVQAVGRSIRRAGDKTVGTIVIPVFVEETKDPELALDDSTFKPVWDVVKALRSHDEELAEFVDSLRRGLGRGKKRPALPSKIVLEIPLRVGEEFAMPSASALSRRPASAGSSGSAS